MIDRNKAKPGHPWLQCHSFSGWGSGACGACDGRRWKQRVKQRVKGRYVSLLSIHHASCPLRSIIQKGTARRLRPSISTLPVCKCVCVRTAPHATTLQSISGQGSSDANAPFPCLPAQNGDDGGALASRMGAGGGVWIDGFGIEGSMEPPPLVLVGRPID